VVFQNDPDAIKRYAPFVTSLDVPTAKIDDAPYVCIRLNAQWIPFILGAVETLRWDALYKGTEVQINAATAEVERLFLALAQGNIDCPEDAMALLRQNPEDPCQLQASYDDGVTWATVFDYSVCMQSETKEIVTVANAYDMHTEVTNNMAVYEGDITNVYAGWGYGDDDDEYRDEALCWALRQWIDLVCELAIKLLHDQLDENKQTLEAIADSLQAVGEIVAIMVGFELFPAWAVYAGLAFTVAGSAGEVAATLMEVDPSVFQDDQAKEEVACVIYNAMKGVTPSFADWNNSLDNHGLMGNAGHIADASFMWQWSDESFVQFFKFMGPMIDIVKYGADLGCPCEGDWTHIWEISELSGSEPHTTYNNDAPAFEILSGEYVAGVGIDGEDDIVSGKCKHRARGRQEAFNPRTITRVRFDYDWAEGAINNWGAVAATVILNGVIVGQWNFAEVQGSSNKQWSGNKSGVTRVVVAISSSNETENECQFGGTAVVERVVIEGKGTCPFCDD
jgi:hypothetical protein